MSQDRECRADVVPTVDAPCLSYLPRVPHSYKPAIALIGCGGIAPYHLRAYKRAGYTVSALCDHTIAKASALRDELFPDAAVFMDYRDILRRDLADVVDVATHPAQRVAIIGDSLAAGKHVLSQKPFVLDLDDGARLADLADANGVCLVVNQNGRWAPHFSYIREAVSTGLLGAVSSAQLAVHWDHNWTADTVFNELRHLVLYDFAVHWFDIVACIFGESPAKQVFARAMRSPRQRAKPPLLADIIIEFETGLASISFNADTRFGAHDQTIAAGSDGTIMSNGPDLNSQTVTLTTQQGRSSPVLQGDWFSNGFHGAMAELLCAIEEKREPCHSARNNLRTLALCFAAIESADSGRPVTPGVIRRIHV
ncbi:MAG: Gfo/Idh/MocA family oxidoreductase [Candidatus Hydrogenedentes bacterium]|nr:Gfo/Idh/MocA family oxidoreductase [Candidatus Hydrogenedentota bacterium]